MNGEKTRKEYAETYLEHFSISYVDVFFFFRFIFCSLQCFAIQRPTLRKLENWNAFAQTYDQTLFFDSQARKRTFLVAAKIENPRGVKRERKWRTNREREKERREREGQKARTNKGVRAMKVELDNSSRRRKRTRTRAGNLSKELVDFMRFSFMD